MGKAYEEAEKLVRGLWIGGERKNAATRKEIDEVRNAVGVILETASDKDKEDIYQIMEGVIMLEAGASM
jgi:hypothetical protein